MKIRFGWQLLYRTMNPLLPPATGGPFFQVRELPEYVKRISAHRASLYHPVGIYPTNVFHRNVRAQFFDRFRVEIKEKNFPYDLSIAGFAGHLSLGMIIHLFPPDLISIRVMDYNDHPLDRETAFSQRSISQNPEIRLLADLVAQLYSKSHPDLGRAKFLTARPLIAITTSREEDDKIEGNIPYFVALLINDVTYHSSSDKVYKQVIRKNEIHNRKSV